jgi:Transglutaminase-like superfamily
VKRPPSLSELRAAVWANRALGHVRRDLSDGWKASVPPAPPRLPAGARRGVEALLRRRRHSCLEGAIVRQRWLAAHAIYRDVVIGITSPAETFTAHAWVDGEEDRATPRFVELTRLSP